MIKPVAACDAHPLADGVLALPGGFALLTRSRALICADAHLGYEDVMGGGAALPLWSTTEIVASIALAVRRHGAREIVFLGDAIHGAGLTEGAARAVGAALDALRAQARVTVVAGNHEGRTRGVAVLGATVESCERDGWTLAHGDRPSARRGAHDHRASAPVAAPRRRSERARVSRLARARRGPGAHAVLAGARRHRRCVSRRARAVGRAAARPSRRRRDRRARLPVRLVVGTSRRVVPASG